MLGLLDRATKLTPSQVETGMSALRQSIGNSPPPPACRFRVCAHWRGGLGCWRRLIADINIALALFHSAVALFYHHVAREGVLRRTVAVPLSKGEYALLLAFLESPQPPLTREYLLQATRVHEDIFGRSIDVQVLRLRRKLEVDPSAPRVIQTDRGVGYLFAVAGEPF